MKRTVLVLIAISACSSCFGQLTPGQKLEDFQALASLYAKRYAPGHWKLQAFDYNLLNLGPWISMVQQTTDDLGFYEIMSEYVASLNDAHSVYQNPSDFAADLGFSTDIYDGKVLIDSIDRTILPAGKFPFQIGDEVMMVDNRSTDDLIKDLSRFFSDANKTSTSRDAAGLIPFRVQAIDPRAEEVGASATVVIRRQKGNLETYVIPWTKSGTPLTKVGPVPFPQRAGRYNRAAGPRPTQEPRADYRQSLLYLRNMVLPERKLVLNFDAVPPVFNLPTGFIARLGTGQFDPFYSGTYKSGAKTIGYIRIPDFLGFAEDSFDVEIAFMEQNTDGLVVDVMRNPGGDGCFAEDLMSRLVIAPFHDLNIELRPTLGDVQAFQQAVTQANTDKEPAYVIALLQQQTRIVTRAYQQGGLTVSFPACQLGPTRPPNKDATTGKQAVYTKPTLLLTDEFSASAADLFAAMFQDAKRGKNFGMRTMGAGGSVLDGYPAGYYSEGFTSVTNSLIIRANPVVTADYRTAPLIENIGVRPEVEKDYMTTSNLLNGGKDFVTAFTTEILTMIGK